MMYLPAAYSAAFRDGLNGEAVRFRSALCPKTFARLGIITLNKARSLLMTNTLLLEGTLRAKWIISVETG